MSFWSVVQTEVQRERTAVEHLTRAGFVTYAPRIKVKKRGIERTPLLFPTYVFVLIERCWHDARWSPGVVRLLMDGDRPARLQDRVMDEIRSREVGGYVKLKPPPKARKGERVRINGGRFDGFVGVFEGQTTRERQHVLLEMLGAWRRVELGPADAVEVVPSA
jgi:transcriptional antiterminator RfaH